jgi:glycosyltransferase involved in cell wall biosynthesis
MFGGSGHAGKAAVLVSVIIPAYRAEATIGRALDSLRAQTWPDWEAVVVSDDGQDYAALAREAGITDPRLRFVSSGGVRTGCHRARNAGLAQATGDFVLHCDADDVSHPERLSVLVPLAAEYGAAVDNPSVVSERTGALLYRPFRDDGGRHSLDAASFLETSVPLFPVVQRSHAQPRLEGIEHVEDVVANLRLIDRLGSLVVVPRSLSEYRVVDGSMCHGEDASALFDDVYAGILRRLTEGDGLGLSEAVRPLARDGIARKRAFNRAFGEAAAQAPGLTFQDFAARHAVTA